MYAVTNTTPKAEGRVVPWNKGKLIGQKPPLKLKEIWAIRIRLQLDHRARELALFNLAIDSKLRGCDLVGLHVRDVFQGSHVAARAMPTNSRSFVRLKAIVTDDGRSCESPRLARSPRQQGLTTSLSLRRRSHAFRHTQHRMLRGARQAHPDPFFWPRDRTAWYR